MPLYEMTADAFRAINQASFAELKVKERGDLQRLLRSQIDVLGDDLYVLAEEFGDWEESKRRIDLLAIDREANLVVIELKRTSDGGHMDLQAIRYAAMVSTMTFERAVQVHGEFLASIGQPATEARERIVAFLGKNVLEEEKLVDDVRIVLVSEDFSKELTSAVLWLNDRDIDIRCVRLRSYQDGTRHLIDVQQIIPLPEANDYQVQLREKQQVERKIRAERHDVRQKFWESFVAICRSRKNRHANLKPGIYNYLGTTSGVRGLNFNFVIVQEHGVVELYIDRGDADENERIFNQLLARKDEIERAFGGPLSWEPLEGKRACRIKHIIGRGGYKKPESEWPAIQTEMVETMTRLEAALKPSLAALGL